MRIDSGGRSRVDARREGNDVDAPSSRTVPSRQGISTVDTCHSSRIGNLLRVLDVLIRPSSTISAMT